MAGAVDVGVVTVVGCVFDVRGGDGDAAFALFRGFVDGAVFEVGGKTFGGLAFGDCCCECCLLNGVVSNELYFLNIEKYERAIRASEGEIWR